MKFTPSSSVSSSTTTSTSTSFSENFRTSRGHNFGCLSGFLSKILRFKTLPTHLSQPIENHEQPHFLKIVDGSNTPSVVARLMGLDSMPEFSSRIPQKVSDSIKSVNSEDFREETGEMHRRMKISFSFKETSDYFELEDDDFFVPSKSEKRKKKKKKVKFGSSEVAVKGHRHRKGREKYGKQQGRNREEESKERVFSIEDRLSLKISAQNSEKFDNNVGLGNQSYHLSPLKEKPSSRKEESEEVKGRKKKRREKCLVEIKEDPTECESENLSPVSVLDHSEFISDPEPATPEEDVNQRGGSNQGIRDYNFIGRDYPCEQSNGSSMWEERESEGSGNGGVKKRGCRKHDKIEMVISRSYRLAEAEIGNNNSNWKYRSNRRMVRTEELEDAVTEFGQLLFDHLVTELVHQLVGLHCHHF